MLFGPLSKKFNSGWLMHRTLSALLIAALSIALPVRAGSAMAKLSSVENGSTLVLMLKGESIKVRMHGVVVPPNDEKRPILQRLNNESSAFLKKYLADTWVYLEFPEGGAKPDADGLTPAFVYRGSDATFLNEKLVGAGLALVNKNEKNSFTEKWLLMQENARAAEHGIWGSFEEGEGARIASGSAQGTYIGVPGATVARPTVYVTYWIIHYY
jgi:endonuclease YncB( thermonuclease family)